MNTPFITKKSLGQHFLTSDIVPNWLCDAAAVQTGDTVVEIGPGTGALTKVLLERGATVLALEADARAITILKNTFTASVDSDQLVISHLDVRQLDLASLPELSDHGFKIVSNIPYYLSGHLFRTSLQTACQPSDLVFLVQKEVAKRAAANHQKGDKHSLLSLATQVYGDVSYVKTVSRGHFTPSPRVDSGIIAVRNISRQRFATSNEPFFFEMLHLGFAQKRKQLLGNLAGTFDREQLTHIFSTLGLPETIRAEDVSLENWLQLVAALSVHTASPD